MLNPARGHMRSASTASFVRIVKHRAHRQLLAHTRWQTTAAVARPTGLDSTSSFSLSPMPPKSLAIPSEARFNEIKVQLISSHIFNQVFPNGEKRPPQELVDLSRKHLERHNLLGKNTDNNPPIAFQVPKLQGQSLDEHFYKLGSDCAEPFLTYAKEFARANTPPRPRKWVRQSGWTKYYPDGRTEKLEAPDAHMLCFDVEVMWKESPFAVMACAASPTAWYAWISPWLLGESPTNNHLVPLGDPTKERIIVGHNVGYDRARTLEEYNLEQTRNSFIDTMSLHVAVNGMCSRQRPTWMKHKKTRELREKIAKDASNVELANLLASNSLQHEEEDLWIERSAVNSLRDVAQFHLNTTIDKAARDDFGELDRDGIVGKLDELLDYCAADVNVTHRVYQIIFPNFLEVCPHPVSFAALRHLASVILPVDKSWDAYIERAEAKYIELSEAVQERLISLTKTALEVKDDADTWGKDPWLKQLDWSGQEIKWVKGKKKGDPGRPALRQKKPGMPKWYKDLFKKANDEHPSLTVRTRIAPLLLKLCWDNYPLFWSDKYGWTFRVPQWEAFKYSESQLTRCDFSDAPKDEALRDDVEHLFFKLPHKDGPDNRCTNPLAKSYQTYFEKGTLSSEYPYAKEALEMNSSCSYWISARERIRQQMVVYEDSKIPKDEAQRNEVQSKEEQSGEAQHVQGFILPQVIPMGTITRRAVENTWLTASNAKKNRVGSELKSMVKAPPGYSFVGADVDSEELWIASVIGDATFKLHGGNAIGFMTLEGTKAAGTDLHSRTASILGITRNDAKVFNYGRIYGAGLKFASTLLRQFNPSVSERESLETAGKLYVNTKGTKTNKKMLHKRAFWRGGTESFVFNKLEEFAEQEHPRTPVLGAGITEALMSRYISKGAYLTSRINWAIQSSGVDYLHLLVVSMDYLIRCYNIKARLSITVHDEIRYLVKNEDKYRAAMALQVANLWTRAMFAEQVGIPDLPQACAYFSAVDIDHVLRKEVDMECVTPSHPTPIPPGESVDIIQLLEKGEEACLDPNITPPNLEHIAYTPRTPIMETLDFKQDLKDLSFLKAQIADNESEVQEILKEQKKKMAALGGGVTRKPRGKKVLPYSAQAQLLPTIYQPFEATKFTKPNYNNGGQWVFENMPDDSSTPRNYRAPKPGV